MNGNKKMYRCLWCFHVRSGALALGTWHLMVHLFAISLLAYMSANIDEINNSVQSLTIYIRRAKTESLDLASDVKLNGTVNSISKTVDDEPMALPLSLQTAGNSASTGTTSDDGDKKVVWYWTSYVYRYAGLYQTELSQHDLNAAFVIGCIIVAISTMMIVGITKNKPAYILPFLGYQLGDLFVSSLTVAGLICLGPNIKQFLLSGDDVPYRQEMEELDNQWFIMSVALAILAVIFIKAYFVQVVWLSIRYLREEKIRAAREECQPKVIFLDGSSSSHDSAETNLFMFDREGGVIKKSPPPAYEDCGQEKTAPPTYTV